MALKGMLFPRIFVACLAVFVSSVLPAATVTENSPTVSDRIHQALAPIRGFSYNSTWHAPGGDDVTLDCSNVSRFLTRSVFGTNLPRTASDQYLAMQKEGRLRKVGRDPGNLARILKPGDLLFWEHTYSPKRPPPITHVMVYLGQSAEGEMLMAGAQSSRGVDVYRFRPDRPHGGYRWFFFFKREGRFVAYARPVAPN